MDAAKKKRLEAKGWTFGDASDFLQLSPSEEAYVNIKFNLAARLKELRTSKHVTQKELAVFIGSSQSRVAKMEAADPSVSIDLLVKSLLTLQEDPQKVEAAIYPN